MGSMGDNFMERNPVNFENYGIMVNPITLELPSSRPRSPGSVGGAMSSPPNSSDVIENSLTFEEAKKKLGCVPQLLPVEEGKILKSPVKTRVLFAIAIMNYSDGESLGTREICDFVAKHFRFFGSDPKYWSKVFRNTLSKQSILKNSWFWKSAHKRWSINPEKRLLVHKELTSLIETKSTVIKEALLYPENFEILKKGCLNWCPVEKKPRRDV